MIFLVDGERREFRSDSGSERNRGVDSSQFGARVEEIAYFEVDAEFLAELASADDVEVAIYGDEGRVEARFNRRVERLFQEFADEVL